ncbi:hypothetical protein OCU04_002636 [Sclerotinia nivalis]|uniref:Heterokaryon incompatibility domain-containing protein n=1 Tax=Sclerotinia nivalis TaxID=352851 RepID=A0A9X0DNS9_9HELO|nr:hypothetical protein OCU04_002636 [Sclerotinia nivalis]
MDSTDPQLQYAALSYSCGDSPTLKTTKENKDEHVKVGILMHDMIMSTRQLFFGEKMVQFRCDDGIQMEDGSQGSNDRVFLYNGEYYDGWWFSAVEEYSSRELSYSQDRLGGLAGVAKLISDYLIETGETTEYLAGLWLSDRLHEQLLWEYIEPKLTYTEMLEYLQNERKFIAPSWSWASQNVSVIFPRDIRREGTKIQAIGYDLQPLDSSAMIAAKLGSSITLRGKCRQTPYEPISGYLQQTSVRSKSTGQRGVSKKWQISGSYGRISFWLDWVPNTEDPNHEERKIERQLQLFLITNNISNKWRLPKTSGLLLLPFESSQGAIYRRVGVFERTGDFEWFWSQPDRDITIW